MSADKTTFALFFGNRSLFPASLQSHARQELTAALRKLGHDTITMPPRATRHGAVETPAEGRKYAEFLREKRGEFGGVILCLPNFGDETGAVAALQDADVPILVQAYPDELDKMSPRLRRDAFCGKLSIMDVFNQYDVPFTALTPHAAHPKSDAFAANVDHFDRVCRVYNGMKDMVVGAIGARTTAFKTVRFDEVTLQRHGVTTEVLDLSDIFARFRDTKASARPVVRKIASLKRCSTWKGVPASAVARLGRLGVVLDCVIKEYGLDALAIRCWVEMEQELGITPCVLLGCLNEAGVAAACEVDVCSAVTMRALSLAAGGSAACLDWNNNYGDEEDKCILFHCGPVPPDMMAGKGCVIDNAILASVIGPGRAYGCNVGRIAPTPFTFGNLITEDGRMCFYLGEGRFTDDPIANDFFGCGGVAQIPDLQDKLQTIGYLGHRHHPAVTAGHVVEPVAEAFERYLAYDVTIL